MSHPTILNQNIKMNKQYDIFVIWFLSILWSNCEALLFFGSFLSCGVIVQGWSMTPFTFLNMPLECCDTIILLFSLQVSCCKIYPIFKMIAIAVFTFPNWSKQNDLVRTFNIDLLPKGAKKKQCFTIAS